MSSVPVENVFDNARVDAAPARLRNSRVAAGIMLRRRAGAPA